MATDVASPKYLDGPEVASDGHFAQTQRPPPPTGPACWEQPAQATVQNERRGFKLNIELVAVRDLLI